MANHTTTTGNQTSTTGPTGSHEYPWYKSYQPGVPSVIDTSIYSSVNDLMEQTFQKFANKPAFTNMGKMYTFAEMDRLSYQFACYLQNDLKLARGDRVALMMPNILQYPVALYGVLRAGMIVVNCNPLYTVRELEHQLKDSGAKAIVIVANFAKTLEQALPKTEVKHVIVTELGDLLGFPKRYIVNAVVKYVKKMVPEFSIPKTHPFLNALRLGATTSLSKPVVKSTDLAFLQYTGGTTGVSKGAMLSHGNVVSNMMQLRTWMQYLIRDGEEVVIAALPFYHIFSLTVNCLLFASVGGHNVMITNPRDIPGFIKELMKWKFTIFPGLNTLFNALMNNPDFMKLDFSRLKISIGGGMAVQRAVAERWQEMTKTPLVEGYGLTETAPVASVAPLHKTAYSGYIGLPISSTVMTIRDDNNQDVELGQVGEICIKGPQVMMGYWNRPDETAKVMSADGFFKSGDLGYMTEDGYFKIVDRKKDMILVSGFNVYPNEIEDVVAMNPKVLEVAAIGVPDTHSGEVVKIFVVKKDASLTEEELKKHCKANLTGYKIPKHIEFRSELPKTNVGKILRKDLRDEELKKGELKKGN
jgi:long-chain acyl-CoA synthetase